MLAASRWKPANDTGSTPAAASRGPASKPMRAILLAIVVSAAIWVLLAHLL